MEEPALDHGAGESRVGLGRERLGVRSRIVLHRIERLDHDSAVEAQAAIDLENLRKPRFGASEDCHREADRRPQKTAGVAGGYERSDALEYLVQASPPEGRELRRVG